MELDGVVVIKVGGSLLDWPDFSGRLRAYLDDLRNERILLVIGGGGAAEFVRQLDSLHGIGENRSHELALRALDLTAHVVATLVPGLDVVERLDALAGVWIRGRTPVLAPRSFLENDDRVSHDPLPANWETTTDSIAARAASVLEASELRLLKSVGLNGSSSRLDAAAAGLVDSQFPLASAPIARVTFVNLRSNPPTVEVLS
jgi:aspartokinase-like uncharacterized kinase